MDHIPLGSARLANAFIRHDPPTDEEFSQMLAAAADATSGCNTGVNKVVRMTRTLAVFVGGTATNVARLGRLTRSAMAKDHRRSSG